MNLTIYKNIALEVKAQFLYFVQVMGVSLFV